MNEDAVRRNGFKDEDFSEWPLFLEQPVKYIHYAPSDDLPDFDSVRDGKSHSIKLKNLDSGELEEIEYRITSTDEQASGGVRFSNPDWGYQGYQWVYASVKSDDHRATLNFCFDQKGACNSISILVLKTWSPKREKNRKRMAEKSKQLKYAAQITAIDPFTHPELFEKKD